MHLLLPPALPGLILVEADQVAIVALVQGGIVDDRKVLLIELAQNDLQGVLSPFQGAGKRQVQAGARCLEHAARAMRLRDALLA